MEIVIKKALRKFSEYLLDLRAGKNFESLKPKKYKNKNKLGKFQVTFIICKINIQARTIFPINIRLMLINLNNMCVTCVCSIHVYRI